jgi:4-amino-4-deoxy-L-arabinose transferase-like glycosyltransferase
MKGWRLKTGIYAALAIAAGVVLRLWFVTHAARIDGDTLLYGNIARNWMEHGVYSFSPSPGTPVPTLIRLPGYPLFLMACFWLFGVEHYTAVMYVQCVIDLGTCLLIAALAGRLFGRRARMAALWLAALCPFMAAYTAAPLTEVLTLACLALTFYGLERWRVAAGAGFARCGCSSGDGVDGVATGAKEVVVRCGCGVLYRASARPVDGEELAHIPRAAAVGSAVCN